MNTQKRFCKYCGVEIIGLVSASKLYCSEECYKKSKHKNAKEEAKEEKKRKKERKKNQQEITRLAKEANKNNISYGKMIAKQNAPHFDRDRREWVFK